MANTYTLINSTSLSSSAASVTFSAIPATYTDLVLKVSARSDYSNTSDQIALQINSITSGYSETRFWGNGSIAQSGQFTGLSFSYVGYIDAASNTSSTFANCEVYIPSYTASQYKPFSTFVAHENNSSSAYIRTDAKLLSNTNAITGLTLSLSSAANFVTGSTFYLYGIKNS